MHRSMRVYAYLRASTMEQDALRAKEALFDFAESLKIRISTWFIENESGAKLQRPELFRLLDTAEPGDAILIEQIDRITRLSEEDWRKLKSMILDNCITVISMDLPTSHNFVHVDDEFQRRVLSAVNSMMLDILAATARKDYTDRRRRQADGVLKARLRENIKEDRKIQSYTKRFGAYWMLEKATARFNICWDAPGIQSLKLKREKSKSWPFLTPMWSLGQITKKWEQYQEILESKREKLKGILVQTP